MNKKFTSLEESLAEFTNWANQLAEGSNWVTSDSPLTAPETSDSRAQEARSRKQDMLKQFAQLGAVRAEFKWAADYDVFMTKDQILDYLDQTVEDPDLTPLEYMHNNGYSTDGILKGMLKSVMSMGLGKADIFNIFKSARRGNTTAGPGMISRVAKNLLRSEVSEDGSDSKAWMSQVKAKYPTAQFIQAKMPGAPIRAMVNGKAVAEFKTPKPVEEGTDPRKDAEAAADFILANKYDRDALRKFAGTSKSPQVFYKAVEAAMYGANRDELIRAVTMDRPWHMEESATKDISALYDDWMSSDFAPFDSDAGDDREVMRKAEAFLDGQVAPDQIESYAEMLADQYHGNPLGSASELEEATALTGQYGHSGKLQAVQGTNADMMDRIRFLAGLTK